MPQYTTMTTCNSDLNESKLIREAEEMEKVQVILHPLHKKILIASYATLLHLLTHLLSVLYALKMFIIYVIIPMYQLILKKNL